MMHGKLHVDTLILLPMFKIYVFSYSRQTDRQTDKQTEKYTRFAWAGGTFFPVELLCQFLVLAGNRFWFYILTYAT
jgi:hypothetical protein